MNVIEQLISTIAPHSCVVCDAEGALLSSACAVALPAVPSRCYRCAINTTMGATCKQCRRQSALSAVWVATIYEGAAKEIVHQLKFNRANAAATNIAWLMAGRLPHPLPVHLITFAPTAPGRVRARGYDQAARIAREVAQEYTLPFASLLARVGDHRQVGQSGATRRQQMKGAFRATRPNRLQNADVLLVDDVLTTGATLEAAAAALKAAGARRVYGAVFAQA